MRGEAERVPPEERFAGQCRVVRVQLPRVADLPELLYLRVIPGLIGPRASLR